MSTTVQGVIDELHRRHYRELVAPLIRILGSFERAEDVVQDAFATAWSKWTEQGIPDTPLAWLRTTAKHRAIDDYRRSSRWTSKASALTAEAGLDASRTDPGFDDLWGREDVALGDDSLRLIFTCCHPSLNPEAQVALTLRTVCGLTSEQVARAFLLKASTLQQRIVRAKKKIDQARIPYVIPTREELPARLDSVLRTVYLVFNEGYGASDGDALIRRELCDEAIRLGRLLSSLLPEAAAVRGLLALMMLHHSRRDARTGPAGELVTLERQDRGRWDRALIDEALPLVDEALRGRPVSSYAIEAAIAALHATAAEASETDWAQISALYGVLEGQSGGSPVVSLNAAVATAMSGRVDLGLRRLEQLEQEGRLSGYHLLPVARGELWLLAGKPESARDAFEEALGLVRNPVERRHLQGRLSEVHEIMRKTAGEGPSTEAPAHRADAEEKKVREK